MRSHSDLYIQDLKSRGFSNRTLESYGCYIRDFLKFIRENTKKTKVTEITKKEIEAYQNFLFYRRDRGGKKLSVNTQQKYLITVRSFFDYLMRQNKILLNPGREVELPKEERKARRRALKSGEIERLFNAVDLETPGGYRDRVIMELFYSTGIRISELIALKIVDIQFENGLLFVEKGKGGKDRYVPLCDSTQEYLKEYIHKVRPLQLKGKEDCGRLFLKCGGEGIRSRESIEERFRGYREKAGIRESIGPQHLRVSCATAMLRGGASERHIQELLGHERLTTTERYLEALTDEVKNTHTRFHPREE